MKKLALGSILHISSQKNIVVKSNYTPKIGKKNIVTDKNQKKIGYIYDIIGPINKPYILIKPLIKFQNYSEIIGDPLYIKRKRKKMNKNG